MRQRSRLCRGGALVVSLALTAGLAHAADAPPAAAATAADGVRLPHVEVAVVGNFVNGETVSARVASWFTGQGVPTQTRLAPALSAVTVFAPTEALGVRLWILLSTPTTARLFFAVQEGPELPPRFLVQDVELRSGLDELGLERLAQVAYFSATAAWDGSAASSRQDVEQGLRPNAAPEVAQARAAGKPQPKPSAPPLLAPPKPYWHYVGGFSYETKLHGDEGTFIGTGTHGGIGRRSGQNDLSARLVFEVGFVPHRIRKSGVTLKPNIIDWGLMLGAKHTLAGGFSFGVELGASLALISHRLPFNNQWRDLPRDSLKFTPKLKAGLGCGWEWGSVKLGLFATAEVPLVDDDYVVQSNQTGEHRTLLSPWPIQPGFSLRTLF